MQKSNNDNTPGTWPEWAWPPVGKINKPRLSPLERRMENLPYHYTILMLRTQLLHAKERKNEISHELASSRPLPSDGREYPKKEDRNSYQDVSS